MATTQKTRKTATARPQAPKPRPDKHPPQATWPPRVEHATEPVTFVDRSGPGMRSDRTTALPVSGPYAARSAAAGPPPTPVHQ